jgi:manganese/zinc/iron transport system substrate-binding protein
MKRFKLYMLPLLVLSLCTFSCREGKKGPQEGKLNVLCTTSMIGESVSHIVGDSVNLVTLMGAGVDPHLYKPTPSDLKELEKADIIILNGLHLEGKMAEVLSKLEGKQIIHMSELVIDKSRFINNTQFAEAQDPHFWFDTDLWKESLGFLTDMFRQLDKKNADYYYANWKQYEQDIIETETYVAEELSQVPDSLRVLITSHDAFSYLGRKFDIEVKGLQGISTVVEFGLKDVADIVDFIVERNIRSIFVESTVSDKAMQAVVDGVEGKGGTVTIGGILYGDAVGDKDKPEGTYLGMLRHNAHTISTGLNH